MWLDPYFLQLYLHHLGVAHTVAGDRETAAAILRKRILLVPENDMSRAHLAAALGNLGYAEEARRVWGELKAIDPRYSFADRAGNLPSKNLKDFEGILKGLRRAGILDGPDV
ncbi:hypothetical protein ACMDCR_23930 [Labrys okinawensis]|uniref:hypothetical protein n=1 Tax=Labrys okinawensis TaxID=346911 RepID=UPI0039BC3363